MFRVAVMYLKTKDSYFDMSYYLNKHVPMVQARLKPLGLLKAEIDEGMASAVPGEQAPFMTIGILSFEKIEDFQKGMGLHAAEIMGDIPNFTNVQPQIQISRVVLES
jgi:uncharacterized protein (TIGR02118 family)